MSLELLSYNAAEEIHNQALTSAWRREKVRHPSLWDARDPASQEKMLRDAVIGHAVEHRCGMIAGRDWNLTSRNPADPRGDLAIAVGTELMEGIKKFSPARKSLARAFFHGSRYALVHLHPRPMTIGDGIERTWMVPVRLEDQNQFRYRKVVEDPYAEKPKAHWEKWVVTGRDGGQWAPVLASEAVQIIGHVYNDTEESLGYGKGLREALGWLWFAMTHTNQEALGAIEAFARGRVHAQIDMVSHAAPDKSNATIISDYTQALKKAQARHIFVTPKDDELTVLEGSGQGWQMIDKFLDRLEGRVRTLVLSANLPTAANDGGSFALSITQENSSESLMQFDRSALEETLTDDLVSCVWHKNHANLVDLGIADAKPRFSITQEKKQDPEATANVAAVLHGMGVELSAEDVYERTGFKKPEEGEDIIPGGTAPEPLPGFGFRQRNPERFGAGVPT